MQSPRTDAQGRICLTDIRAAFGTDPRLNPSAFLQRLSFDPHEVATSLGRGGATFASPRIAEIYRQHLERLAGDGGKPQRRGKGRRLYSIAELAQFAQVSEATVRRALVRYGMAYQDVLPTYQHSRLLPTVPGERHARLENSVWRWKITVLARIGL